MFIVPLEQVYNILKKDNKLSWVDFQQTIKQKLIINKDFTEDHDEVFLLKQGVHKLAILFQNESILELIDEVLLETEKTKHLSTLEYKLHEIINKVADKLLKEDNVKLEDLRHFVIIVEQSNLLFNKNAGLVSKFGDFISSTRDNAYKFASKTEDDAYKFASNMSMDAYKFTSDTRDKAHDFVMKTEDDAYKFASHMGKDAYQFASKGMEYGYQFASKGEEVGEMANRVLWMASEIGIMADRIGEMADRIVHTEHLIVHTAMLIQNFGLLIDGTMKNLTDSMLYAISMLLNKEFISPQRDINISTISEITMEIIRKNHEYDMTVLEKQAKLREVTISALDKINKKY